MGSGREHEFFSPQKSSSPPLSKHVGSGGSRRGARFIKKKPTGKVEQNAPLPLNFFFHLADCSPLIIVIYYNLRSLSVVGNFIDKKDVVEKVDLGQSFQFRCPQHTEGFGATYSWLRKWGNQFSRDKRRGISPDGTLFITYVTQEDVDDIDESQGIKCRMSAGNSYQNSGTLKLEKNNPEQSGKV